MSGPLTRQPGYRNLTRNANIIDKQKRFQQLINYRKWKASEHAAINRTNERENLDTRVLYPVNINTNSWRIYENEEIGGHVPRNLEPLHPYWVQQQMYPPKKLLTSTPPPPNELPRLRNVASSERAITVRKARPLVHKSRKNRKNKH